MPENARRATQFSSTAASSSIFTFQVLALYSTHVAPRFNAAFCTLKYYLSYLIRPHFNITSFYQCNALIIPVLATLLQLKCQGNDSPFTTHPTTMLVAVSSSAASYLACNALLRLPLRRFSVAAHLCLVCCCYASVASLASLLFPESFRTFVYAIFVLISAAEVLYCCKIVLEEEGFFFEGNRRRRLNRLLNNLCMVATNSDWQRPHILPV